MNAAWYKAGLCVAASVCLLAAATSSCVRGDTKPLPPDLLGQPDAGADTSLSRKTAVEPLAAGRWQLDWTSETRSPQPASARDPALASLIAGCPGDASLHRVALDVAARQLDGDETLDMEKITYALRAQGAPQVWPKVWTLEGSPLELDDTEQRAQRWLGALPAAVGQQRCGVASVQGEDGREVVALVTFDALADMSPFPTSSKVGAVLRIRATVAVAAREARVVVLAPTGRPRTLRSSFDSGTGQLQAQFTPDAKGPWLVQVMAHLDSGPRPVLEAWVHAGAAPPKEFHSSTVPGEGSATRGATARERLLSMLNVARGSESLTPLRQSDALDRLAQKHAEAMRDAQRIAHDLGPGNPEERIRAAGLRFEIAGENVARARNLVRAHRALWASPSHRGNMLHERYRLAGVGVAKDERGDVWVCQLFARLRAE